ncbi:MULTISPECIES: VOC family protein [Aeromicrobium]|uniref:VOC family protein n=1 Tax=Aeromicrobium TaxID=2040 RepID=UPI0006F77171|nr:MULTISPECIES: VOC family protein [Aeromicrobium]KQX72311.1 glyoxalase [Aeromicrobium sp. Root472D3]MCL8250989.1 VOC family protein [Aeromicrobium fastidiosum]
MEQRISLITLGVADLARARRFYEDGLGWVKGNDEDEVAFYQLSNGLVLAIWSRDELAADARTTDTGATFSGISIAFNTRSHDEVDDVLAAVEAAGGAVTKPAEEQVWGGYSGYFADPDGHPWEVAYNPGWSIDETGHVRLSAG